MISDMEIYKTAEVSEKNEMSRCKRQDIRIRG